MNKYEQFVKFHRTTLFIVKLKMDVPEQGRWGWALRSLKGYVYNRRRYRDGL